MGGGHKHCSAMERWCLFVGSIFSLVLLLKVFNFIKYLRIVQTHNDSIYTKCNVTQCEQDM